MVRTVTAPETRRHELYTGLTEILGSELTDTLMSYLPVTPATALVTNDEFHTETRKLEDAIDALSHRFDQLQNILIAGFMSMIVALIVVGFFG